VREWDNFSDDEGIHIGDRSNKFS